MGATINQSTGMRPYLYERYASRMKREKFIRKEAKRWKSVEEFLTFHAVEPCDCGKKKCKGWKVRWKFGAERRREGNA